MNRKTVVRKFRFLAAHFREARLRALSQGFREILALQFDEMQSSIHSKCLPVSIPIAVDTKTYKILDFQLAEIPASGKLAKIALKKYGPRPDRSNEALGRLFWSMKKIVHPKARFESDMKPAYRGFVARHFPDATHAAYEGRRGCVAGQGELKEGGFDPLFPLNQTAAMIRYGVSRLARRTWCTSKTMQGLSDHLELYLKWHNTKIRRAA